MEEFKDKTTEELEVLREKSAENAYVPGSIFHRIGRGLDRRHRRKLEDALKKPSMIIGILSQGKNAKITGNIFENIATSIKSDGENATIANNKIIHPAKKHFLKTPEGLILIVTLVVALVSIPGNEKGSLGN